MPKKEGRLYGQPIEYPPALPPELRKALILQAIDNLQQIERNNVGRESVTIPVYHKEPTEVVCFSDLHIGSLATNNKAIEELVEYVLDHPRRRVVLLGDEIEGIKSAYLDTNRTPIDLQTQIDLLRDTVLIPLAAAGRIDAMVSGYWGHPGWAQDDTTINIWAVMAGGMPIPIIKNGGVLIYDFGNGQTESIRIRHNPPGGSRVDPVSGLRMAELALSESARADGAMSGHIHTSAAGQELWFGATKSVFFISAGTEKGAYEDIPSDRYGEKLGKGGKYGLCDPLGQGVILRPRTRKHEKMSYPYPSLRHGDVGFKAMDLLDAAEQKGITSELKEKIWYEVEDHPKVRQIEELSMESGTGYEMQPKAQERVGRTMVENQYSKMKMVPPYDALTYDVKTKLPITLHLVQNARIGQSFDTETLRGLSPYVELIKANPHSLVVYLRSMLDKEAGKSPNRIEILDNLVGLINGAQEQTLAILYDESMRSGEWKKTKGPEYQHLPVAPASYVSTYTNVPLIHNLSLIKISVGPSARIVGKPLYIGAFADKLMNSGSFAQPTFGHKQIYNKYMHEKPGYVAGGHMPSSGTMFFYDRSNAETKNPILIAPGWWAKYVDSMGKGNVLGGAQPGQAIIFMPGSTPTDYLAFPTLDVNQTETLQDALLLHKGLEILGLTDKVMKKSKR